MCVLMTSKKKKEGVADQGPTSLFLFTPSSPVRRLTSWLVNTKLFEGTVIVTIIANCLSMAMDHKLPKGDRTALSEKLVGKYLLDCHLLFLTKSIVIFAYYKLNRIVLLNLYSLLP